MICLNRTAEVMIRKGLVFVGKNKGKRSYLFGKLLILQLLLLLILCASCSQNRIHRLHDRDGDEKALLMISGRA